MTNSVEAKWKAQFDRDGFLALPQFLDQQELSELNSRLQHYVAEIVPILPRADVFYEDKANTATLKQMQRMEQHDSYFDRLLRGGKFEHVASLLLNDDAVPRGVEYFNKPSGKNTATPPHQDGYYFMLEPCEAVTFWLALDDVDEENGCLRYVAGSHQRGIRPHGRTQTLGFSQGITDFGTPDDVSHEVPCSAHPGDVLVHHACTIHRADPNRSENRQRRSLGLVYYAARAKPDQAALEAYQAKLTESLAVTGRI